MAERDHELLEGFGHRLKVARTDNRLTQRQLADMASVSHTHISDIERGKVDPGLEVVVRLSRSLGVPVELLVSGRRGFEDACRRWVS